MTPPTRKALINGSLIGVIAACLWWIAYPIWSRADTGPFVIRSVAGECQGSCRRKVDHAATSVVGVCSDAGLRVTVGIGVQSRVDPDHRSGCLARAAS